MEGGVVKMDTVGHKMAKNLKQVYDWAEMSGHKMVGGEADDDLT